ncbi:MAG: FAD/NAD(P)-binding oxidoreductase, partial [Actinobacteria bacterium]|nr:FAD/NAD(P)-binding oxidoreductase [Actinomycetota bacterium]
QTEVSGYKSNRSIDYLNELQQNKLITHITGAQVWSAEKLGDGYQLNYLQGGVEKKISAQKIILTTGAYDRTLPFPGWTTSDVMTPGGAQSLLKGHGVVAGKTIVVSGTGPFLLPVATALAKSGARVEIIEAQSPLRWALSPLALLLNPGKFPELIHYASAILRLKIKVSFGSAVTGYHNGEADISKVRSNLSIRKRNVRSATADVVATGWGFLPDVTLGGILGCAQTLDRDETVIFAVDREQRASAQNIWIAGEATGIGGADLALAEGAVAGLSAAGSKIPVALIWKRFTKKLFARALQRSYPVGAGWQEWLRDETIICRCEEVSCQEIIESVQELGAEDARTSKLFTRAGMGLCQGRVCSRNVSDLVAGTTKCAVSRNERLAASNRPIAAPISLGVLGDGIAG